MKTLNIPQNAQVKIRTGISSDALVSTDVNINDKIIKKSSLYKFTSDLGVVSDLKHKGLTIVSKLFVSDGNIDAIMNSTQVENILLYEDQKINLDIEKTKITEYFFIVYSSANLTF